MMKAHLDRLLYHVTRLGGVGAVGAALVCAALVTELTLTRPMLSERQVLVARVDQAVARQARAKAEAGSVEQAVAPLPVSVEATLRRLFVAAKAAGVSLDQGDYQINRDKDTNRARFLISVPVQGRYPVIRDFLARMLNEDPALALASVEMSRADIGETDLDATLHFVLYLKDAR